MITVLFFAKIREDVGMPRLDVEYSDNFIKISELIEFLSSLHGEKFRAVITAKNTVIALNHTVVNADELLHDGDEVAFFPPVTGG